MQMPHYYIPEWAQFSFDGTSDALDFLNTIEARTRTCYTDYQRIMVVELSVQAAAQDWFMQSIQPRMTTMTQLEFKEQFLRYFCPASMRDNYKWQLLHISKGDRSIADYTHEFLKLDRHALDVMQDDMRSVELFVMGLGAAYISIQTEDWRLDSVIEEARQLERRHIMHDTIF